MNKAKGKTQMLTVSQSQEWQFAAEWCAKRGLKGNINDPLPMLIDPAVVTEINEHLEQFQADVRTAAYALAMMNHFMRPVPPTPAKPAISPEVKPTKHATKPLKLADL